MKIFRKRLNLDRKTGNPGIRKDAEKCCIRTYRKAGNPKIRKYEGTGLSRQDKEILKREKCIMFASGQEGRK